MFKTVNSQTDIGFRLKLNRLSLKHTTLTSNFKFKISAFKRKENISLYFIQIQVDMEKGKIEHSQKIQKNCFRFDVYSRSEGDFVTPGQQNPQHWFISEKFVSILLRTYLVVLKGIQLYL